MTSQKSEIRRITVITVYVLLWLLWVFTFTKLANAAGWHLAVFYLVISYLATNFTEAAAAWIEKSTRQ